MTSNSQYIQGIVFDIKHFALHDGPGIRTTVFLKGCPMRCWWCHNPESQQREPESFSHSCKIGDRTFNRPETLGKAMTVEEVMKAIKREQLFHMESAGGITFSGGEPLLQFDFLEALLTACREREWHTCIDTTGYTTPLKFKRISDLVDLFLFDIKLLDLEEHRHYTGVGNEAIRINLNFLLAQGKKVILRFPLIPGITDSSPNLKGVLELLTHSAHQIQRFDLLPYHAIGRGKYQRFAKEHKMQGVEEPSSEYMEELKHYFEPAGVPVQIGG